MRVPGGMDVTPCAIGELSGFEQSEVRGAFEVALLSRQDARVARAAHRGGQPADLEVGAHGDQQIGAAKREHHARPRQQVMSVAIGRGQHRDRHSVAANRAGEHAHARRRGHDVDGCAGAAPRQEDARDASARL